MFLLFDDFKFFLNKSKNAINFVTILSLFWQIFGDFDSSIRIHISDIWLTSCLLCNIFTLHVSAVVRSRNRLFLWRLRLDILEKQNTLFLLYIIHEVYSIYEDKYDPTKIFYKLIINFFRAQNDQC